MAETLLQYGKSLLISGWPRQKEFFIKTSLYHQKSGLITKERKVRLGYSAVRSMLQSKKADLIHRDDWISK